MEGQTGVGEGCSHSVDTMGRGREEGEGEGRGVRTVTRRVHVHFCAGMRSSIDPPFSSFFSISISNLTPSTTI